MMHLQATIHNIWTPIRDQLSRTEEVITGVRIEMRRVVWGQEDR